MGSENSVAYLLLTAATALGGFSLLLFGAFVFGWSFTVIDLEFNKLGLLAWDSMLCLIFFVQHSVMVRRSFRQRLSTLVPEPFHGALYTLASGAALTILVLFWQGSGNPLLSLEGYSRWAANGIFISSMIGMMWSLQALGSFDMFGIQQILAHIHASNVRSMAFTIRGPYRWVRHPLYFCVLVLIWSRPDLTADRLLFNILFTAWITIGTLLEERDLVADFHETYTDYQRRVPMLIPWRLLGPYSPHKS
jgi:hypothetical protein